MVLSASNSGESDLLKTVERTGCELQLGGAGRRVKSQETIVALMKVLSVAFTARRNGERTRNEPQTRNSPASFRATEQELEAATRVARNFSTSPTLPPLGPSPPTIPSPEGDMPSTGVGTVSNSSASRSGSRVVLRPRAALSLMPQVQTWTSAWSSQHQLSPARISITYRAIRVKSKSVKTSSSNLG